MQGIRAAYLLWPRHDGLLRERVAGMSAAELAIEPAPGRWPLWASIGHLACQRVFGLCDFAGEPGGAESPFPNAAFDCPGDDDLEHVWSAEQLVDALGRTFAIVERCLDTWPFETLDEVISHPEWGPGWTRTRGEVIQRQYAHDVWHIAEVNESLTRAGLAPVSLWE